MGIYKYLVHYSRSYQRVAVHLRVVCAGEERQMKLVLHSHILTASERVWLRETSLVHRRGSLKRVVCHRESPASSNRMRYTKVIGQLLWYITSSVVYHIPVVYQNNTRSLYGANVQHTVWVLDYLNNIHSIIGENVSELLHR